MGLGKTLQTIALIAHLKESKDIRTGPSLIVCPLTVLDNWRAEIVQWAPTLKYMRLHINGNSAESDAQLIQHLPDLSQYDIIVTTYEMCKKMTNLWSRQHFHLLVLDEGHKIKNAHSQTSIAVRKIHCENRLLLTGTPLANNLVELYSLLAFLVPDIFTTADPFAAAFDLQLNQIDKVKLTQAHQLLNLFMLRRLKTEVEKLLPKKIETKVRINCLCWSPDHRHHFRYGRVTARVFFRTN
jgi:SWI/SNF-related matrix-associated actin-dependent regulator of chromatin subfamily A member 5